MSVVQFRSAVAKFDPTKGAEQVDTVGLLFGADVLDAEAAIKGFKIGYAGTDHHLKFEKIRIEGVTFQGPQVTVTVKFGLSDADKYDADYEGYVDVMVTAVVAAA